jgi:hypothetical protein
MTTPAISTTEGQLLISTLPPSRAQDRAAVGVALLPICAFTLAALWAGGVQLPDLDAFLPAYTTAISINDFVTAFLLFAQFSIVRSIALIVISSGYLYTGFIVLPWVLTFPGAFTPEGLLGAGMQTTAWLYILWHAGFPLFVIGYALLKDGDRAQALVRVSLGTMIASSVVAVGVVVGLLTVLVTSGQDLLPQVFSDSMHFTRVWTIAVGTSFLLAVLGVVVLWRRRRSVLDLWLIVVTVAVCVELLLVSGLIGGGRIARFTVGWYSARIYSLLSSSIVLLVLLYETTTLYARLLNAVVAQQRERGARLIAGDAISVSIAHEVRQPLAAMARNAHAGLRGLKTESPDLEEVKGALQRIVQDGHRASALIENVRAMFRGGAETGTSFVR